MGCANTSLADITCVHICPDHGAWTIKIAEACLTIVHTFVLVLTCSSQLVDYH